MYRKILIAASVFILMIAFPCWAYGAAVFTVGSGAYAIDGNAFSMDAAPYIESGRLYLPVRYAANAVGVSSNNIAWNSSSRQVDIVKGDRHIRLVVGSKIMILNGVPIPIDSAPDLRRGRVMLPVRFLAQALSIDINWNQATHTVIIGNQQLSAYQSGSAVVVPPLQYDSSTQSVGRDFIWQYQGKTFSWHVDVPQELLDWDRQVNQLTADYYDGNHSQDDLLGTMPDNVKQLVLADSVQENGDLVPWANENGNSQWTAYLATRLAACAQRQGFDYWRTAEFVQSFVGGALPYQLTDVPELSAQTMIDNGDCKDKSVLLAAILKNMSYKVTLLEFTPDPGETGHMAVGVAFDDNQIPKDRNLSYYRHGGLKFYFAETTAPNWTLGAASIKEPAQVYDVN